MSAALDEQGRAEPDTTCARASRPYVLIATILASAMAFIDGTVVHIALPAIQDELGARFADLQWVVNGYTLMLGALILAGGALGDQLGRRRLFLAGIAVFAVASLGCAVAPSVAWLTAARVVQGTGAALMVPQSLAIIAATFPRSSRGRAIGLWAGASALTTALGPVLGGVLIDIASWRWAFAINLPLAVLAIVLSLRHIPENRAREGGRVDWAGALLATVSLAGFTQVLTAWPVAGFFAVQVWAALLVGLGCAAGFIAVQRRAASPMTPPALLRIPGFVIINLMTVLLYFSLGGVLLALPYTLIQVHGYSAGQAGLALLPLGAIIGLVSSRVGRLSDRYGPRRFLVAGPLVVSAGCLVMALLSSAQSALGPIIGICIVGVGMALVVSPLTAALMNSVDDAHSGTASGVNNAASRIAGLFAVAAVGALMTAVFAAQLGDALAGLSLPVTALNELLAQAGQLADIELPAGLSQTAADETRQAIGGALIQAFRAGLLLDALCALAAAALAARVRIQ